MVDDGMHSSSCTYCGSVATRRLGECSVCHRPVCEHCGSIQVSAGNRTALHKECLKKADGHFKMIKFAP